MQRRFSDIDCDLTFEQFKTLMVLVNSPEISNSEIAKILHRKKPGITKILEHLETKEYVIQRVNPNDRRAKQLLPTSKAEKVIKKVMPVAQEVIDGVTENIDPNDFQTFLTVIEKMFHNVKQQQKALWT